MESSGEATSSTQIATQRSPGLFRRVSPWTLLVLCLSIAGVFASLAVSERIFERVPHIEDELAYVWQARLVADGKMLMPSPPTCPSCFLVPFVIDYNGVRFGKYPLAWPVALSLGIRFGARELVNPLLAGLGIWLTYRLGRKFFNPAAGAIAAFLTLTSPFFLMNSGSLLSHPWALFLSIAFALAWIDTFGSKREAPRWITGLTAALTLGALALTRPLTAVGVALPFGLHGLWLLWKGSRADRRWVLGIGALAGLIAAVHFAWQFAVTGDPLMNPYTLWWSYDTIGFGPGVGRQSGGYNLMDGKVNAQFSLWVGIQDLFGWPNLSWIFLPFGIWAARRNRDARLAGSVFFSLVFVYLFYWIGSWLFGPRYYYEGLFSLTILSAAGIQYLVGPLKAHWNPMLRWNFRPLWRPALVTGIVALFVAANLRFYLPMRLAEMVDLYGISRAQIEPFLTERAMALTPALVSVQKQDKWVEYGGLLDIESPTLDSPFVFLYHPTEEQLREISRQYLDRKVYYYYADTPDRLYTSLRDEAKGPE
jgi:4-amino-4-deoxy-L-arabinose transferase-like glycosyltransferase